MASDPLIMRHDSADVLDMLFNDDDGLLAPDPLNYSVAACAAKGTEQNTMNDFSDELFPNFFGDLEPIDFTTTSLIRNNSNTSNSSDDHNYNMAASPSTSDDSGLSSDNPNTPPMNTDFFFKDTVGGSEDFSCCVIKQEPPSPLDAEHFIQDFSDEERAWCVKEEVNLDDLPALSALNNPSSILEDEMAADFLTQELSSPAVSCAGDSSAKQDHPMSISMGSAATPGNGLKDNVFKISGDLVRDIEILTTTSPKTNRVNVVRVNKATLPFTVKDVRQGTIITTNMPTVRSASVAGMGQAHHSSGKYAKIALTDEEKLLLDKEGVALPPDGPLTKEEDRVLKAVRRKIRNKISAKESRKKKQIYVDGLEDRVKACTVHNMQLQKKIKKLEEQNDTLMDQLKKVQNYVANSTAKNTQVSTCAMVLLFSFALILLPSLNKLTGGDSRLPALQQPTTETSQKAPIMAGRSRSLLANQDSNTDPNTIPYGPRDTLPQSPAPLSVLPGRSRSLLFNKETKDDAGDPYGITMQHTSDDPKILLPSTKRLLRENETTLQKLDVMDMGLGGGLGLDMGLGIGAVKSEYIGVSDRVSVDLEGFDNRAKPVVEEL